MENIKKDGYIYIGGDAKDKTLHVYKVGHTQDINKRLSTYNTGSKDNSYIFYETYYCQNRKLAEKMIHAHLRDAGFHYKKEYFTINLTTLVNLVKYYIKVVDIISKDCGDFSDSVNKIYSLKETNQDVVKVNTVSECKSNIFTNPDIKTVIKYSCDTDTTLAEELLGLAFKTG